MSGTECKLLWGVENPSEKSMLVLKKSNYGDANMKWVRSGGTGRMWGTVSEVTR